MYFIIWYLFDSLWYNAPTMLPAGNIVGAIYHKL